MVLVPTLDVGQLLHELRAQYDPSARAGVPPHVTLMFPFILPSELTETKIAALEGLVGEEPRFEFSLVRVCEFERGVVYLDPEPTEPFARLTKKIRDVFGVVPFGGEFGDRPVIHLTVAMPQPRATRKEIAAKLRPMLPIRTVADQAWLMVGNNSSTWNTVRQMPFG